jgi:DNA-binding response OmpR family regulator
MTKKTTASILVVDDEPRVRDAIRQTLELEGFRVLTAGDGEEALALLQQRAVDLVLTDVAMPGMNGYQLYERVREKPIWATVPVIFLTARSMDSDIRYGKELGADDYLTKPIEPHDLVAVIRGKLRRTRQIVEQLAQLSSPPMSGAGTLIVGKLRMDSGRYAVWLEGKPLHLSAREFTLLEYLARRLDQVVSAQELIRATHELDTDHVEAGTLVRPLILSLRRKLGYPAGDSGCIENVRGVGYCLVPP